MRLLASTLLILGLFGCRKDPPTFPAETSERSADCAPCIAAGRNWTGGRCQDTCLLDTYCYGPGNAAAPTCPAR